MLRTPIPLPQYRGLRGRLSVRPTESAVSPYPDRQIPQIVRYWHEREVLRSAAVIIRAGRNRIREFDGQIDVAP